MSKVDDFIRKSQEQRAGTASQVLWARNHSYVSCNESIIPRSHENNGLSRPVGLGAHTQAVGFPYEMAINKHAYGRSKGSLSVLCS